MDRVPREWVLLCTAWRRPFVGLEGIGVFSYVRAELLAEPAANDGPCGPMAA